MDVKVRAGTDPHGEPKILGYDAAGVVERVGPAVTLFRPGDEVWYAGSTAWEALFEHLRLGPHSTGTLLVLVAAGGVGSIAVQLARQLTNVEVIGTASRPESRQYVLERGAHRVVDHRGDLPDGVDYVLTPAQVS